MARTPRIDPRWKTRAHQLKASGLSLSGTLAALEREGQRVSHGWLVAALSNPPPGAATEAVDGGGGAEPATVEPDPIAEVEAAATVDEVLRGLTRLSVVLQRQLEVHARARVCATCRRGAVDVDAVAKIGRVLAVAGKLLAQYQPKRPADPNEHPDMVAAARKAREKLHDLVARAGAGAGAA